MGSAQLLLLQPLAAPFEEGKRRIASPLLRFPFILGCFLVILTVFTARDRYDDPDFWWHLRTGEQILQTHSIPHVDTFSFSARNAPWIAQEWLSQVSIALAYRFGGPVGAVLWLCVIASALVASGYVLCWLSCRNPKIAVLGGMVIWFFSCVGLAIRPHLPGYLFLTIELLILHLGRTRNSRWFYALPVVFALWINCHSSFFLGLVILGIFALSCCVSFRKGLIVSRRMELSSLRVLAIAIAGTGAALFMNPIGPKLITYPMDVMFNQPLNISSIAEWQQTGFSSIRGFVLLGVAASLVLIPMLRRTPIYLNELLSTSLGFWFAACHIRMLFVFGILAAPVLCRLLSGTWRPYAAGSDKKLVNAALLLAGVASLIHTFPSSADLLKQADRSNPVEALSFIRRAGLSGPMLNDYDFGGYLLWAAPERKVFIDGRADLYEPAGILAEYHNWITLRDPRSILDKHHIAYCLMSRDAPVNKLVALMPDWKQVYADSKAVVFVRRTKTL